MKTKPFHPAAASRPRVVCRLVRHWCAIADPANSRHVAACADCREYFQKVNALEVGLRREAPLATRGAVAPSAGLEREILRAVRASAAEVRTAPGRTWRGWNPVLLGAAAAAVLAVGATFVVLDRGPVGAPMTGPQSAAAISTSNPATTPSNTVNAADAALIAEVVDSLSSKLTDSVIPTASEMVANNPLQRELDYVYDDARSALDFLALNFLPSATAASAPPTRRRTG